MPNRKENLKRYFSVEGETELWYFQWLEKQINDCPDATHSVSFNCKKYNDPIKHMKSLSITEAVYVTHVFDYESDADVHTKRFADTLENMKKAGHLGKNVTYQLGYSNFAFELWIVLHKADCSKRLTHRGQYLASINRAYGEHFEDLHQYKHEGNFKRILQKLCLQDVKDAIRRAQKIMNDNKENGYILHSYKGYDYYREIPSLSVWESVAKILSDCGV
jgi:hypothetical protein